MSIASNYQKIRDSISDAVTIVVACKMRSVEEVSEIIDAGATDIGENYVQQGESMYASLREKAKSVRWHMIGHLQKNKINKALRIFDTIQTIDSFQTALAVNGRALRMDKTAAVYIEINIGGELAKSGIEPDYEAIKKLSVEVSKAGALRLEGLMTMGPRTGDPEEVRPFFRKTKEIFDRLKEENLPNIGLQYLSMGMSNSYRVAIEEGSTMIRLGTVVFGPRE